MAHWLWQQISTMAQSVSVVSVRNIRGALNDINAITRHVTLDRAAHAYQQSKPCFKFSSKSPFKNTIAFRLGESNASSTLLLTTGRSMIEIWFPWETGPAYVANPHHVSLRETHEAGSEHVPSHGLAASSLTMDEKLGLGIDGTTLDLAPQLQYQLISNSMTAHGWQIHYHVDCCLAHIQTRRLSCLYRGVLCYYWRTFKMKASPSCFCVRESRTTPSRRIPSLSIHAETRSTDTLSCLRIPEVAMWLIPSRQ